MATSMSQAERLARVMFVENVDPATKQISATFVEVAEGLLKDLARAGAVILWPDLRDGITTLLPHACELPWRVDPHDLAVVVDAAGKQVCVVDPNIVSFSDPAAANIAQIIALAVNTVMGHDTGSSNGQ